MNTFCRWDQIPFKIFWLFWKNLQKLQKKLPAKNVFRFDFKIDGGKSGKIDWKNEIIVIVYDRWSFMSDRRSYFWEFKMNDCGSYSYNYRAHDREWSWLMKKMIVPITDILQKHGGKKLLAFCCCFLDDSFCCCFCKFQEKKFKQKLWIFGITIILNTSTYFFIALSIKKYPYV